MKFKLLKTVSAIGVASVFMMAGTAFASGSHHSHNSYCGHNHGHSSHSYHGHHYDRQVHTYHAAEHPFIW